MEADRNRYILPPSNRNMRKSLLDILACPKCKSDLELEIFEEDQNEVISGKLICRKCNVSYPIEDGIPNLIPQL